MEQSITETGLPVSSLAGDSLITGLGGETAEPRTTLRGIRMPPLLWQSDDLPQRLEFLASWGFNAILLDALNLPLIDPFHRDEDHPASWEENLANIAERLQNQGWWVMAVVPVQLDLGRQDHVMTGLDEPIPCRQAPLHRRRILHRFESILKGLRGLHAMGIAVSEWPRCRCGSCERVTFEEEAAYYLRAFSAVMKRYARDLEFWVLPDSPSFGLLQEIRAEVPSNARFLVEPQESGQKGSLMPTQTEEGMILNFSIPSRYECLDTHTFDELLRDWEQENEPRLLAAEVGGASRFPLGLVSFMRLAWQTRMGGPLPEALLYRLVLHDEQSRDWRKWRDLNLVTIKRVHERHLSALRNTSMSEELLLVTESPSIQPDLVSAIRKTHQRLDLEDRMRPLLKYVAEIPEGVPIDSHLLSKVVEVQSILTDLADDPVVPQILEVLELRALENLRDRINLLVSEGRAGATWRMADVPDLNLWLELLANEE
jgi:hypothetical protein